ncbi:hypothetical protein ACJJTC_007317 [Scirpophaga incertulas]
MAEKDGKPRIDLDTILVNEVGQFGLFQLKTLLLAMIVVIFAAWAASEYVFTTARIRNRCLIPECETAEDAVFAADWVLDVFPSTGNNTYDGCKRFANVSSLEPSENVCPAIWFDNMTKQDCEQRLYEDQYSVVYDLDLGCEEWRRSLIGSVRTFGTLTVLPLTGFVSDRWGRRTALALNAFNTAWIGVLRYFANTYVGFMISEFAEATFGSGGFSAVYILLMEVVGPKHRVLAGVCVNSFFSVGQMTTGLIAWAVPYWRELTLVLYMPQLLTILYFWLMTESVRWYMSKGRYDESETVLRTIAKVNGKKLSDKSLEALRLAAEEEMRDKAIIEEQTKNEPLLIVQVFRHKKILLRCMVSPVWWITTTLIYYGLSINAVNLVGGNRYLNYVAVTAAQIPGYWTAFLLLGLVGRKTVLIGAYWICGTCQLAYIFLPEGHHKLSLALYLIGTYSISVVMTSVYVYTAELYPTKYRHSLFAFSSMMGRIGSIIAPLTPALGTVVWVHLPYVLFAFMSILSGCLVFVTPETLGTKFPDTMEEASELGSKQTPKL